MSAFDRDDLPDPPPNLSPAERAFYEDACRIAEEVSGWSDEDKAAYLKEHGLEDLVAPERVDWLLEKARRGHIRRRVAANPKKPTNDN